MGENKVCRLCLNPSVKLHCLFKESHSDMLRKLTGIKIKTEESPESCIKCLIDLKMAYNIQQSFIKSNNRFVKNMSSTVESELSIKIEPILCQNKSLESVDSIDLPIDQEKVGLSLEADDDMNRLVNQIETNAEAFLEQIKSSDSDRDNDHPEDHPDNSTDWSPDYILIESKNEDDTEFGGICRCHICGSSFNSDPELYTHTKEHYKIGTTCELCGIELDSITSFREHLQSEHKGATLITWMCEKCHLTFQYKPLFDLHMSSVHEGEDQDAEAAVVVNPVKRKIRRRPKRPVKRNLVRRKVTFINKNSSKKEPFNVTCECCNRVYTNKSQYQSHVIGSQKKKCPICETEISAYNMTKHIMMHNSGPMVCHLCGATAKNNESLRGHLYYTHSQRQYPCEHCGRVFNKKYTYTMHVKKEHIGEKTFVCDTCGKKFFTQYNLNVHHKMTHLKLRDHICDYCKKAFSSRFARMTHQRQHTNETPYVCDVCGEGFRQKVSLKSHKKTKHNIIEKTTMECKECGKMFASDFAIKSHMRLHL